MKTHLKIALLLGSMTGLGLLYYFLNPAHTAFLPQCPFFRSTGYLCPGCGSQRAFHELLHGNWQGAARYNLLLVLSMPFLLGAGFVNTLGLLCSNQSWWPFQLKPHWLYSAGAVVLAFWIFRNIPTYPFSLLAP
jgi:hypothetical protein